MLFFGKCQWLEDRNKKFKVNDFPNEKGYFPNDRCTKAYCATENRRRFMRASRGSGPESAHTDKHSKEHRLQRDTCTAVRRSCSRGPRGFLNENDILPLYFPSFHSYKDTKYVYLPLVAQKKVSDLSPIVPVYIKGLIHQGNSCIIA